VEPDGSTRVVSGVVERGFATVVLEALDPATLYRYRVENGPWHEFTTPPSREESFSFAVVGDMQPFNAETDRTTSFVMAKVASLDPLFALQIGDVTEIGISARSWRRALSILSLLGAQTPLVMTAGNHDYYYGLPSARYFKSVFPAPYEDATPSRNTWYSTSVAGAHIAVLDTEADGDDFERQIDWLAEDLEAARARGARWLFIAMHRPLLASATTSEDERWAKALLPLVARYRVAAVFWGHDHMIEHYEYTYGANGFVLNEGDAPATQPAHLFTTGTAGARVDSLYSGFFTHRPYTEEWVLYPVAGGEPVTREFVQHPWREDRVRTEGEGVRYQRRSKYPEAASYYSYPFESAADEAAGRYSDDPTIRYSGDAEFFGYTYGETSIHYLWIDVTPERCTITAHYADGAPGEPGTVIVTPGGTPMRWEIPAGPTF
jgi:3',5'-cyclic AMP phosphodiesterase CpdA